MLKRAPIIAIAFYVLGYAWVFASIFSQKSLLVLLFLQAPALCSFICGSILLTKYYLSQPLPTGPNKTHAKPALLHFSALATYLIPYSNYWLPQIIWLKNRQHPDYETQAINCFNFQFSTGLYLLASMMMSVVIIGIPMIVILFLFHLFFSIYAGFASQNNPTYNYPGSLNIVGPNAYVRVKKKPKDKQ